MKRSTLAVSACHAMACSYANLVRWTARTVGDCAWPLGRHQTELYAPKSRLNHACVSTEGKSMKHPTPSDFIVNVKESHVSVIFKPSDSYYNFGRLTDPEDVPRYGPLSRSPNVRHAKTDDIT